MLLLRPPPLLLLLLLLVLMLLLLLLLLLVLLLLLWLLLLLLLLLLLFRTSSGPPLALRRPGRQPRLTADHSGSLKMTLFHCQGRTVLRVPHIFPQLGLRKRIGPKCACSIIARFTC